MATGWGTRAVPRRLLAVVVVLASMTSAVGGGVAAAAVTVTATPTSGLVDGQEITVTGSGTMGESYVFAHVCPAGEPGDCGNWLGDAETAGNFVITGRVRAQTVSSSSGLPVDCRSESCDLVVMSYGYDTDATTELARVPLGFDPHAPLLDPPSVTVDPDHDLVDGQTVQVSGAGHHPLSTVWIDQCPADGNGTECRSLGYGYADGDGRFDEAVIVRSTLPADLWTGVDGADCRDTATPCLVVAQSRWGSATAPVTFDPDSPAPPGPTLVVDPATGIADGDTVEVTGAGFTPDSMVALRLCATRSERCDIASYLYAETRTDGTLAAELVLYDEIADHTGFVPCAAPPGCEVRAIDWGAGEVARAPVAFRPGSTPQVRYLDPVFAEVEEVRGVVYRHTTDVDGGAVELALDIYLPAGDTASRRPVTMWMFGGWFMFGDREQLAAYAMDSARRGYVGVAIDYRIRPDMDLADLLDAAADAEEDARAAIDWLRAHAEEYRLDPDAIVASGVSAGAVLAWNLAYGADDLDPAPSPVAAAVPISGVPLSGPEPGAPPVIAFHAVDDGILPIGPDRETCPLAAGVGSVCRLVEMPDGGHYIAESHVREIVAATYAFLAEHVLGPLGYFPTVAPVPNGPPVRPELYPPGPATATPPPPSSTTAPVTIVPPGAPPTSAPAPTGSVPRPPTTAGEAPTAPAGWSPELPEAVGARPVAARPRYTG